MPQTAANVSFHDAGLTKAGIQARAALLVKELHVKEAAHAHHLHRHHQHHPRSPCGHVPEQQHRPRLSPGRGPSGVADGSPRRDTDPSGEVMSDDDVQIVEPPAVGGKKRKSEEHPSATELSPGKKVRSQ